MSLDPSGNGTQAAVPLALPPQLNALAAPTASTTTLTDKRSMPEMMLDRPLRKMPASNSRDPSIACPTTTRATTASGHDPPPVTYHSTVIQTLPPATGELFKDIHGRYPTHWEHEHKIGLAARGRYEPGVADPHLPLFGTPFEVTKRESKATYVDSAFQTADVGARKIALTKAKVKASMTARKYSAVIANAGYKSCAESKDERILHSERHSFNICIDDEGNVRGEVDLTGRFLPNVYMEDKASQIISCSKSHKNQDDNAFQQHAQASKVTSWVLTPPLNPAPLPQQDHNELPRQIAAIEPSSREDQSDIEAIDSHDGAYEYDSSCFVVHDPEKVAPLTLPRVAPTAPQAMSKRKRHDEKEGVNERKELKRLKISTLKGGKKPILEREVRYDTPARQLSSLRHRRLLSPPFSPGDPLESGQIAPDRSNKSETVPQVAQVRVHSEKERPQNSSRSRRERSEEACISPSTTDEFDKEHRNDTKTLVQSRQSSHNHEVEQSRYPLSLPTKVAPPLRKKLIEGQQPLKNSDTQKQATKIYESIQEAGKQPQPEQPQERRFTKRSRGITTFKHAEVEVKQSKNAAPPNFVVSQDQEVQKLEGKAEPHIAMRTPEPKNREADMKRAREAEDRRREAHNATRNETGSCRQATKRSIEQVDSVTTKVVKQTDSPVARATEKIKARRAALAAQKDAVQKDTGRSFDPLRALRQAVQATTPSMPSTSRQQDRRGNRDDDSRKRRG
jgi:hypothetical protein